MPHKEYHMPDREYIGHIENNIGQTESITGSMENILDQTENMNIKGSSTSSSVVKLLSGGYLKLSNISTS